MNRCLLCDAEGGVSDSFEMRQIPVGSNLFELIEFTLTRSQPANPLLADEPSHVQQDPLSEPTLFGVNVAKVREVIRLPHLEPALGGRREILGLFHLRGVPVPAIHLSAALGFSQEPVSSAAQVLVTEFSGRLTGFVVAGARRIRRVSWEEVIPPQKELIGGITGMMLDEQKRFIFILDFEKVLSDLESGDAPAGSSLPLRGHSPSLLLTQPLAQPVAAQQLPVVLIVDDSPTARKALQEIVGSFSCSVHECGDGEQAWQECLRLNARGIPFMVISDIEMPRLDGYSFARRVKTDGRFSQTPFLLHSSLSGQANRERAMASGADAFIGKFNKSDIQAAVETCLHALGKRERIAS
jgi:two-component system chemotaxis response regulator CheV